MIRESKTHFTFVINVRFYIKRFIWHCHSLSNWCCDLNLQHQTCNNENPVSCTWSYYNPNNSIQIFFSPFLFLLKTVSQTHSTGRPLSRLTSETSWLWFFNSAVNDEFQIAQASKSLYAQFSRKKSFLLCMPSLLEYDVDWHYFLCLLAPLYGDNRISRTRRVVSGPRWCDHFAEMQGQKLSILVSP